MWGRDKDPNVDKFEELEKLRKAYRTPAEETFAELGEGRGTCFAIRPLHDGRQYEHEIDIVLRYLCPWIRRATPPENQGGIWH